ncbi:MAG TPA: MFS transporter [Thermoanaerobaculia bacterium]|nr:MFS transporter [Thermoanaerobaculia bacterium]
MNPWRGLSGLPRALWVLAGASLVNRSGTMFLPFLVLYLTSERGFTPGAAGLVFAVFGAGSLAIAPVAGRLADRIGAVRLMRIALMASGALLLLVPFARGMPAITVLTLLIALTGEMFRPASLSVVSHLAAPDQRKAAFALQRLAVNLGMSVGPAAGGFLAAVSWPALFIVDGVTSLLAAATLIFFFPRNALPAAEPSSGAAASRREGLRDPALVFFLVALVPVCIVFFQHESSMSVFLVRDVGLAVWIFGLLHTVNTLLIVFVEVPLNLAMAHWPHRRSLVLGSVLVAAGFGALAWARSLPAVVATVVVWTFGEMILVPSMSSWVADVAPPDKRGAYMGLYTMAFSFALVLGGPLGTTLLEHGGGRTLWLTMLALGLLSAALFTRVKEPGRAAA